MSGSSSGDLTRDNAYWSRGHKPDAAANGCPEQIGNSVRGSNQGQWPDGFSASGGNSPQNSRQQIHLARLFASRQTPVFAELRRSDNGCSKKPDPLFWFVPSFLPAVSSTS